MMDEFGLTRKEELNRVIPNKVDDGSFVCRRRGKSKGVGGDDMKRVQHLPSFFCLVFFPSCFVVYGGRREINKLEESLEIEQKCLTTVGELKKMHETFV